MKLRIAEAQVNGCDCFAFDPNAVYKECNQLGYENPSFALEGYRKENEMVDDRPFDTLEFQTIEM